MDTFLGHWKLSTSDDKWDDYMKAVGVNFVLRKVGNSITSYEEHKIEGDDYLINITSTFKCAYLKFKFGEEFDEVTVDGRKVKSLFTWEGDNLVQYQRAQKAGEVDSRIVRRRVDENTMTITIEAIDKGVVSVRTFVRYTP